MRRRFVALPANMPVTPSVFTTCLVNAMAFLPPDSPVCESIFSLSRGAVAVFAMPPAIPPHAMRIERSVDDTFVPLFNIFPSCLVAILWRMCGIVVKVVNSGGLVCDKRNLGVCFSVCALFVLCLCSMLYLCSIVGGNPNPKKRYLIIFIHLPTFNVK